jgi:hypothetical protein
VGLVARELERRGVVTVSLVLLHAALRDEPPPRALWVPFFHGYALGPPDDPAPQREIVGAALDLLRDYEGSLPVLKDFRPRRS